MPLRLVESQCASVQVNTGPVVIATTCNNGRSLELLLTRWAVEGSEANSTQLEVPASRACCNTNRIKATCIGHRIAPLPAPYFIFGFGCPQLVPVSSPPGIFAFPSFPNV